MTEYINYKPLSPYKVYFKQSDKEIPLNTLISRFGFTSV